MTALKFMEMLIELSRESLFDELEKNSPHTKSYMKVHALLDYIHEHYAEKIISSDIEQRFECNYDYINRVFAKLTGHTIMRYVNQVRINHAKELIEATHLSFGEIGYLTGLDDPFYFSKVFKNTSACRRTNTISRFATRNKAGPEGQRPAAWLAHRG